MKIVGRILLGIAAFLAVVAVVIACLWGKELDTVSSVKMVDGNKYLYTMEYKADYDLDALVEADIDSNSKLLEYVIGKVGKGLKIKGGSSQVAEGSSADTVGFSCTAFQARKADSTGFLSGRNYDFFKNPTMVTISRPENGYASIACSDMSHFGYSLEKLPESLGQKIMCIASIYAPVDGMNEKGVYTSILALPKQASQQNTGKHVAGTTIIMRLILDRCATTQEAIDLVNSLDIRHDATAGSGYHYMVSDANGDCAVIEFDLHDGWKTMITRKPATANYLHVTNHLLAPKYYTTEPNEEVGNPHSKSWWRYATVASYMDAHNGILSVEEAQECLSQVHWKDLVWENGMVEDTQYSNVYDQAEKKLYLRSWNEYDVTHTFEL